MDERDDARLDGVGLFVLDDSFDALFKEGLIATVGKHGLVEQPLGAARAAPAGAECEEDGDLSSKDVVDECVVGTAKPRCASQADPARAPRRWRWARHPAAPWPLRWRGRPGPRCRQ